VNPFYNFLPADLIFERSRSVLGKLIRWAERARGEEPAWPNHVAGFVSTASVCEALTRVKVRPWSEFVSEADAAEVWRHVGLTPNQRIDIAQKALSYKGRKYGGLKLFAHLGDAFIGKLFGRAPYLFRRLCRLDRYPICSWLWAWSYARIIGGEPFGVPSAQASPDNMHDHVRNSPDWIRVYP